MELALIIKKPYLDLILDGKKTWEMRSRRTKVTGWIGLIEQGSGLIVGKAYLVDGSHAPSQNELLANKHRHRVDDLTRLEKWRYRWELEGAERFITPIEYAHPRGAVIWVRIDQNE